MRGKTAVTESIRPPDGVNRLFAAGRDADYRTHLATYGTVAPSSVGPSLVDELERSGLSGRGGAGFPVARKFGAAASRHGDRLWARSPVVIANGAEGEPRSIKDSTLLRHAPHLVIDGLLAAGAAVGASKLYLYAPADSIGYVRAAVRDRKDARSIVLVEAKDTFISGEASAVVNAIENGIALPTDRIVRLTTSGLRRLPTLVHNVETLAQVGLIARFGAGWFRSLGSERDPGTRLVTVSGFVPQERVMEVAGHTSIADILMSCGIDLEDVSAVLVGGYHGAWIARDRLSANLSAGGLAPYGARPGAGILYVLGRHECPLVATASIVHYLATESARQCGPCMFGLPEMASLLERLATGDRERGLRRQLEALTESVVGRGSCHHPDGTAGLVLSTLSVFAGDVDAHLVGRCQRSAAPVRRSNG
jgi:NADH:ubiquinone oxidoreductase subunit F (NADH-binding)